MSSSAHSKSCSWSLWSEARPHFSKFPNSICLIWEPYGWTRLTRLVGTLRSPHSSGGKTCPPLSCSNGATTASLQSSSLRLLLCTDWFAVLEVWAWSSANYESSVWCPQEGCPRYLDRSGSVGCTPGCRASATWCGSSSGRVNTGSCGRAGSKSAGGPCTAALRSWSPGRKGRVSFHLR